MEEEFTDKEKLEFIMAMVSRLETLRANIGNRSGIILSANAILIAGETFIIEHTVLGSATSVGTIEYALQLAVSILLCCALIFQAISAYNALTAIAYVWSDSKPLEIPIAERIYFHGSSTRNTFNSERKPEDAYKAFRDAVNTASVNQLIVSATAEWWNGLYAHGERYTKMREAVKWISISLIFFTISFVLIVVSSYL